MSKLLKIGIAGCGAIGSSLAKTVQKDFKKEAELAGLFDIDKKKSAELAAFLGNKALALENLSSLIKKSDLVVEATHAKFSYEIAKKTLQASCSIMVMSVGGIINKYKELSRLARKKNQRIYIPSGAICGLDGLKAVAGVKIKKVTLTTRKPPAGFKEARLVGLRKEKVIFEGNARDAVKYFPQNINVAATLSIAGIGPEKTGVRIIVSPKIRRNIHEIEIVSDAGVIFTRTENIVHPDNPKTSFLAVLSAIAALKQILQPVKIGT